MTRLMNFSLRFSKVKIKGLLGSLKSLLYSYWIMLINQRRPLIFGNWRTLQVFSLNLLALSMSVICNLVRGLSFLDEGSPSMDDRSHFHPWMRFLNQLMTSIHHQILLMFHKVLGQCWPKLVVYVTDESYPCIKVSLWMSSMDGDT